MSKILDLTGGNIAQVFEYDKSKDILDIPDTYTLLNELVLPDIETGVYIVALTMTWVYDRTTNSAYFRFSTDGGVTWNEFIAEPKDKTDSNATFYSYPFKVTTPGTIQIRTEARKESLSGQLDVKYSDVWIERKGSI